MLCYVFCHDKKRMASNDTCCLLNPSCMVVRASYTHQLLELIVATGFVLRRWERRLREARSFPQDHVANRE